MKIIESPNNIEIKAVAELLTPKGRKQENKFIAEGVKVIKTLLDAQMQLIKIYCTKEHLITALSYTTENNIVEISTNVLNKLSTASTPSGMVALFAIPTAPQVPLQRGVVLAQIQDPGNMGTLIRTAAAMNVKNVIVVEGCEPWSPKVIQATAGTIGTVTIVQCNWAELLEKKNNLQLCALVVHNGKTPQQLTFSNCLLVVGNEAQGLPQAWIDDCQEKLTLQMPGKTESLNAAVAGSIAMYLAFAS